MPEFSPHELGRLKEDILSSVDLESQTECLRRVINIFPAVFSDSIGLGEWGRSGEQAQCLESDIYTMQGELFEGMPDEDMGRLMAGGTIFSFNGWLRNPNIFRVEKCFTPSLEAVVALRAVGDLARQHLKRSALHVRAPLDQGDVFTTMGWSQVLLKGEHSLRSKKNDNLYKLTISGDVEVVPARGELYKTIGSYLFGHTFTAGAKGIQCTIPSTAPLEKTVIAPSFSNVRFSVTDEGKVRMFQALKRQSRCSGVSGPEVFPRISISPKDFATHVEAQLPWRPEGRSFLRKYGDNLDAPYPIPTIESEAHDILMSAIPQSRHLAEGPVDTALLLLTALMDRASGEHDS